LFRSSKSTSTSTFSLIGDIFPSLVVRPDTHSYFFFLWCRVKEENFWRNYFYRVSLIKQSAQLSALSKKYEQEKAEETVAARSRPVTPPAGTNTPETPQQSPQHQQQVTQSPQAGAPAASHALDTDFISDTIPTRSDTWLNDMKDELDQLGVKVEGKPASHHDDYDWEKELAKELGEYEPKKQDSDWESEIKEMLDD